LTLPPSLPSPYQQHISYSAAGVGTAYATAFLGCYAPAIVSGNPANFYMSIGSVTTNSSGVWTYYNTTNNTSTGTSCTPNAVVSVNANPVNASGVVINTINSITTKVISGTCVLMAATTPLYNNALYSALANCTVYVQVSGY